jgi:hypothetical protein
VNRKHIPSHYFSRCKIILYPLTRAAGIARSDAAPMARNEGLSFRPPRNAHASTTDRQVEAGRYLSACLEIPPISSAFDEPQPARISVCDYRGRWRKRQKRHAVMLLAGPISLSHSYSAFSMSLRGPKAYNPTLSQLSRAISMAHMLEVTLDRACDHRCFDLP